MRCHTGDEVIARRQIDGIDVPQVPAGCRGTVVKTTMFGKPKRVFFAVSDGWGLKRFHVNVHPRDVVAPSQVTTETATTTASSE
jgi:hypothetical protein